MRREDSHVVLSIVIDALAALGLLSVFHVQVALPIYATLSARSFFMYYKIMRARRHAGHR